MLKKKKYSAEKAAQISRSGEIKQLTVQATGVSMKPKCIPAHPPYRSQTGSMKTKGI